MLEAGRRTFLARTTPVGVARYAPWLARRIPAEVAGRLAAPATVAPSAVAAALVRPPRSLPARFSAAWVSWAPSAPAPRPAAPWPARYLVGTGSRTLVAFCFSEAAEPFTPVPMKALIRSSLVVLATVLRRNSPVVPATAGTLARVPAARVPAYAARSPRLPDSLDTPRSITTPGGFLRFIPVCR